MQGVAIALSTPYHHGDLKARLLELAELEIEAVGYEALGLATLAARAGVSKAAPYRHFRGREDLLIALAVRGFTLLKQRNAAAALVAGTAADRIRAACLALVGFAGERPELYRMMFASDFMRRCYSPARWGGAVRQSFEVFESLVAAAMPDAGRRDIRAVALGYLASVQGYIVLRASARMEYLLIDGETEATLLDRILEPRLRKPTMARPGGALSGPSPL